MSKDRQTSSVVLSGTDSFVLVLGESGNGGELESVALTDSVPIKSDLENTGRFT